MFLNITQKFTIKIKDCPFCSVMPCFVFHCYLSLSSMTSQRMTDDDYDTEPYEGPTSSPEEMRYLEQDEA